MIKLFTLLIVGALFPAFGQGLDLSSLDKLSANATSTTNVMLDKAKLQTALQMMPDKGKDGEQTRKMLGGLNSLAVRTFEFAKPGAYSLADLEPVRAQLKEPSWSKIIEVKDKGETVEIYMRSGATKGFAVISAEPKELTVVGIDGAFEFTSMADLALIPQVTSTIQFHDPEASRPKGN
ncbi:MAG: DUF4252 domain-containing protein [Acidobacteriota bacterium]|nr:DUF4252 domain-containing protein [Acidobacteriota bacterium]